MAVDIALEIMIRLVLVGFEGGQVLLGIWIPDMNVRLKGNLLLNADSFVLIVDAPLLETAPGLERIGLWVLHLLHWVVALLGEVLDVIIAHILLVLGLKGSR